MSKTFSGLISIAASSTTSGSELTLDVITGVPDAIASSGGNPKPSYSDGKTNAEAASKKLRSVSNGTKPRNRTEFSTRP